MKYFIKHIVFFLAIIFLVSNGCVYYNTFYNAKQAFNDAEKTRKASKYGQQRINQGQYKKAIEKSLKVIESYPNSKYYDDALYVLGVSYYYTKQYNKAERKFREIIANYENSEYITDAYLYRAKSKLELGETDEAMEAFVELLNEDLSREFKAEAATGLAMYHFENRRFDESKRYFLAVRDTLGSDEEKKNAQRFIADGYFEQFRFEDARGAYLQILGMDPDPNEHYHAHVRASSCSYRLLKIDEGLDYINTLMDDERYYDSLHVLMMYLAEGYEYESDVDQAEAIYQKVADETKKNLLSQSANYRLGLIFQYDYDDLTKAKEYYDASALKGRSTETGLLATQKSTDIGKLDEFERTLTIDSTTTQEMIDEAAYIQYQLAELLWFKLNKPDTAILEMQYVVDSFPIAYDAPKAIIALSQMVLEYENDTTRSDSIIQSVLKEYPQSDFIPEALEYLGLLGTEADTGYAGAYLIKAEGFLVDQQNIDSARYYYQIIVDRFPESQYYLRSRFALIWMTEMYESPGDSSVILAYNEFVDSFSGTTWAGIATNRTKYRPSYRQPEVEENVSDTIKRVDGSIIVDSNLIVDDEVVGWVDPEAAYYIDPNGESAMDFLSKVKIKEERQEFIYPTEAYSSAWEGELVFQIQLDFSGEVIGLVQKSWSDIDEINLRAEETLKSTVFDVQDILPEMVSLWYVYRFKVIMPRHLK